MLYVIEKRRTKEVNLDHVWSEPITNEIGIVTAFFDIGRAEWTEDKNLPSYLYRSTDMYFERFARLARLDNEMVIYTSPDLTSRVRRLRQGKERNTKIIAMPYHQSFEEKREAIAHVQNNTGFQSRINPSEVRNPEYWSPDYVLINSLKPIFAAHAVRYNFLHAPLVAWVDFGYCENDATLGGMTKWRYPFSTEKIHLFVSRLDTHNLQINHLIQNNIPIVGGGAIVAGRDLWRKLAGMTQYALDELLKSSLVDDDQTLLLMASLYEPELFELHKIQHGDWRTTLMHFNCPSQDDESHDDIS